jgi:hypothetical protein
VQVLDLRRRTPNLKALEAGKLDQLDWAMTDENLLEYKELQRIEKEAAFRLKRTFERSVPARTQPSVASVAPAARA